MQNRYDFYIHIFEASIWLVIGVGLFFTLYLMSTQDYFRIWDWDTYINKNYEI